MLSSFTGDAYQDDYELAEGLRKKVEVWDNKAPLTGIGEGMGRSQFPRAKGVFFLFFV